MIYTIFRDLNFKTDEMTYHIKREGGVTFQRWYFTSYVMMYLSLLKN